MRGENVFAITMFLGLVAFIVVSIAIDELFKRNTNTSSTRNHITGRSCYDCKHCNAALTNKNGCVYCKYDDEFYFPETGQTCDDFNK